MDVNERKILDSIKEVVAGDEHLSDADIVDYAAGVCDDERKHSIEGHLSRCEQCTQEVRRMADQKDDMPTDGRFNNPE